MRRMRLAALFLMMTGCQSRPLRPVEIEPHDMCSSCRMAISQNQFAAQLFDGEENVYKFDDVACMLRFVRQGRVTPVAVFVADYNTRQWIQGNSAMFVKTDQVETPMGGGLLALSDSARAVEAARQFRTRVLRASDIGLP
jgi:copper chaperone NosL